MVAGYRRRNVAKYLQYHLKRADDIHETKLKLATSLTAEHHSKYNDKNKITVITSGIIFYYLLLEYNYSSTTNFILYRYSKHSL